MRIVIAGSGEVGSHLAKLLSNENQDILVIDEDAQKLAVLDANYNLMTVVGNPTNFTTQREAGVEGCDLFIAVTPYETNNIVACSIAKNLGAKVTVARIDNYDFMNPTNAEHVKHIGVDRVIYPEYLAACDIKTSLQHPWVRNWFELYDGEIILVGVKVHQNAPIAGVQLKDFTSTNRHFHVSAIKRNYGTIIPRGSDTIEVDDILYITTTRSYVNTLREMAGKQEYHIRKIIIMGGSKMAVRLANLCGDAFDCKIIERNIDRCHWLAEKAPEAEIIHGDARDPELLSEVGIYETDAFIALTDSSETNILSCLSAKELGVVKTVANVENLQFVTQAENLNIGTIVNKKLLASSTIFQLLLDADNSTSKCLALSDAEVAELEVKAGSKVTKAQIKDLKLSRNMTFAGLIRQGKGMLIQGTTQLQAGDHVLVFCLSGSLYEVERLFS